jgi:pilus assembly protein CpaF
MEGEMVTTQEIFRYKRRGVTPEGKIVGTFEPTGVRPLFAEKLKISGVEMPKGLFD